MAILGIALLACLFVAIIGKQAAQALLKGVGVVIGLIAVYLVIGSQIMNHTHPTAAPPVTTLAPEQLAAYNSDNESLWILAIFVAVTVLYLAIVITKSVRWRCAQRAMGHGLTVRDDASLLALGYDPPPTGRRGSYRRLGH